MMATSLGPASSGDRFIKMLKMLLHQEEACNLLQNALWTAIHDLHNHICSALKEAQ
jgi:hypothetical protein